VVLVGNPNLAGATMCNCGKKDQTPKEVIDHVKKSIGKSATQKELLKIVGTGLFLLPNPKGGVLEYQTVVVPKLDIEDCRKRGGNCLGYKWIPESFMSLKEIEHFFESDGRPGECFGFCQFSGGGCPPLCWCPPDSNFCH